MNPVSDTRFLDLAMKGVADLCTAEEKAELDEILASQPKRGEQYQKLQREHRLVAKVIPLIAAMDAPAIPVPGYVQNRLRAAVTKSYGPEEGSSRPAVVKQSIFRNFFALFTTVEAVCAVAIFLFVWSPARQRSEDAALRAAVDRANAALGAGGGSSLRPAQPEEPRSSLFSSEVTSTAIATLAATAACVVIAKRLSRRK